MCGATKCTVLNLMNHIYSPLTRSSFRCASGPGAAKHYSHQNNFALAYMTLEYYFVYPSVEWANAHSPFESLSGTPREAYMWGAAVAEVSLKWFLTHTVHLNPCQEHHAKHTCGGPL